MKTEINFRETSRYIPYLKLCGEKLIPLEKYPTSKNVKVWVNEVGANFTSYHLISYEESVACYHVIKPSEESRLRINVSPDDLTATTRKHIYAFIRQFVPTKQAEAIINTARTTFALPPMSTDIFSKNPVYEMVVDVYPE